VPPFGRGVAGLTLAVGLFVTAASATRPVDEAILPPEDYRFPEARVLAVAHGAELVALYEDVRRCAPELDFQLDGIAFQRPRQSASGVPHLTLWVFLDAKRPPLGATTAGRATEAVREYGRKMIRRLSAREPVAADGRVGGYGLILSWVGPRKIKDLPVMESLVVFARKEPASAFAAGDTTLYDFLTAADVRLFDGQEELPFPALAAREASGPPGLGSC
jgi:hypothetical protein